VLGWAGCLQAARSSVVREANALAEQKAAVTAMASQLEQREESLVQVCCSSSMHN
jgi:hypothetical protein